jgi:hypothetical protein
MGKYDCVFGMPKLLLQKAIQGGYKTGTGIRFFRSNTIMLSLIMKKNCASLEKAGMKKPEE